MVKISGAYGKLKTWVKTQIADIVLSSLKDVDNTNKANDKILQYKSASEKHEYVDPPSGYTDAEAVAAVLADDAYLKNDADDATTGKLQVDGKLTTGSEVNDARATRALNLIDPEGVMRIWRYTATLQKDPSLDLIWGNTGDNPKNVGNYWWDIYVLSLDGGMYFRNRTGATDVLVLQMTSAGNVGIGCTRLAPATKKLEINGNSICLRNSKTPATSGATGKKGEICWDTNYMYICVTTNTWKRSALSTW